MEVLSKELHIVNVFMLSEHLLISHTSLKMLKGPGTKECHSSSMTRKELIYELIKKNKAIV